MLKTVWFCRLSPGWIGIDDQGAAMRIFLSLFLLGMLLLTTACTTTPDKDRPKIICPACGTELDSIYHKRF
jgi:hypothetical protein